MRSVVLLTQSELSEFVLRFDEWRLREQVQVDAQAVQIAEAYRLPADQRVRVAELLTKNREERLSADEEAELDGHLSEMDRRLVEVAGKLGKLTDHETFSGRRIRQ